MLGTWQTRARVAAVSAIPAVTHFSRLSREGSPSFDSDGIYIWVFPKQTFLVT